MKVGERGFDYADLGANCASGLLFEANLLSELKL